MQALLLMIAVFFGYILVYRFYGKYISKKIFNLSEKNKVPSVEFNDGKDFVPTKKSVIFGHHFTSIAGTGPIVGPAIAIIWGWIPAVLWVFLGSILIGAIHDLGALVISLRNEGKSISTYTARYINNRTRIFFFIIVFLELWIVISIFGLIIAIIFKMYPSSVVPVWFQIPIAVTLGYQIYKRGRDLVKFSIFAIIMMYITVIAGNYLEVDMPELLGIPATGIWTIILLIYTFFASTLPVTILLQPRDYINAYQLIIAMALLVLGVVFASFAGGLDIVAPAYQQNPAEAPSLWPFLFITIACGAVSGFHSLVSSGTSSKQLRSEKDALFVSYGSMLTEGALAILVIIAVSAGIGMGYQTRSGEMLFGFEAWNHHYSSWAAAGGLREKIGAFVDGSANMIGTMGIPRSVALVVMGVFVASFANTTLDTATRLQRYVITELLSGFKAPVLKDKYFTTFLAIATAAALAFATGADGGGALSLWPLFGSVNQTLAALSLIIISVYLRTKGGWKWLITGIPAIFMGAVTLWAIIENHGEYAAQNNLLLQIVNLVILVIVVWIIVEGVVSFIYFRKK